MFSWRERWIFFDLDGTLVDSLPALYEAYLDFLSGYGKRGDRAEFRGMDGYTLPQIVHTLKKRHALKPSESDLKQQYIMRLRASYQGPSLGARPIRRMLLELKGSGCRIALVTSALRVVAAPFLKQQGLDTLFDSLTFGNEVRNGKPSPDIYQCALRKTGAVDVSQVLVFEDSANGVLSAEKAGLRTERVDMTTPVNEIQKMINRWRREPCVVIQRSDIRVRTVPSMKLTEAKKGSVLCCVEKIRQTGRGVRVRGSWESYQKFCRAAVHSTKFPPALGVTGITLCGEGRERRVLMGKRSLRVRSYPGMWEPSPSGGIDGHFVSRTGQVDYKMNLIQELLEEVAVGTKLVKSIKPMGMIYDPKINVMDLVCVIDLNRTFVPRDVRINIREYSAVRWIRLSDVKRFIHKADKCIPSCGQVFRLIPELSEMGV